MKKSRFTDSQIIAVLKQAQAGTPVPELCREHGVSSATFYKWRSKFGSMDASLMSQLKELQDENRAGVEPAFAEVTDCSIWRPGWRGSGWRKLGRVVQRGVIQRQVADVAFVQA